MLKNQRHCELLDILKEDGFASVRDLSERLYASQPTVRRDLIYLEQHGYVRRNHGGAILANGTVNTPIPFRKGTKPKEKAQICQLAATLLHPDTLIFTDASTTAVHLVDYIKESDHISVLTNGMLMCHALAEKNFRTFMTGGRLLKDSEAFVGATAERTVREFYADYFFVSAASISEDGVVSDYSEEETHLRRTMRENSRKTVLLIEAGKFGTRSPFCVFTLAEVDFVVINMELPPVLCEQYHLTLTAKSDNVCLYQKNI